MDLSLSRVTDSLWGQGAGALANLAASKLNDWAKTVDWMKDRKVRLGALIAGETLAMTLLPRSFGPIQNLPQVVNAGMGVTNAQLLARELGVDIFQAANLIVDSDVASAIQERDFRRALSAQVRQALSQMGVSTAGLSEGNLLALLNKANKFPGGLPALIASRSK